MLAEAVNAEMYGEWLAYIETEGTRDAFLYLVGLAACVTGYTCFPKPKGVVRAFRFMLAGNEEEQPFAFIPNQEWLLFYFRLPAVRSGRYSFDTLREAFDSANENEAGEWTVKLRSISEVKRLWRILAVA
jgi:hypothetical protein